MFGNFFVAGKEFDALILKGNAIVVIDFKNFGGELTFSENGPWKCDDVIVKGGNSRNPFLQIRSNKFALLDYIKSNHVELLSQPNLGHIAGLVIFHQPIEFDRTQVPQQVASWFHICDLNKALRTIDSIASAEIDLSPKDIEAFVKTFDTPEYHPDGKLVTRQMIKNVDSGELSEFSPLGSQKDALDAANTWLNSDSCAFVLKGMSSTGKRTILTEILKKLKAKNKSVLLVAPNARLAEHYTDLGLGEFTSIYQALYSNKSNGEVVEKSNGIELAKHPVALTSEQLKDNVLVVVEAHLISNSYYDMNNVIFGTGHMVNDLLNTFGDTPPKLLLVGDPYQLARGDLEQCLLSTQAIRDKELSLTEIFLEQQIESEPKALHDFQFDIAQQMQIKQFNHLPNANNDTVKKIDSSPSIGREITTGRYHAVYLCGLNDVAHKINMAAKQRVLQQTNPNSLCIGDLVDFHTSSLILVNEDGIESGSDWVHSGEIATITEVSEHISVIELTLKGRDSPTSVRIGEFRCNVPILGEVRLKYLVDYLHTEKPELTQDQMLLLSIMARQEAEKKYKELKGKVKQLKGSKSPDYAAENKKYKELVQNQISHSPLLNAARIRYAYAMTVHRAQGRAWNNVFLDASRGPSGNAITNDAYFRFLYTASMCAKKSLNILKYPKLTPLYKCQFIPNNNCKVRPFSLTKGFDYTIPESNELESFVPPSGFESNVPELKALSFNLAQKLQGSDWRILKVKQSSFQELYILQNTSGKNLKIRFHYGKGVKVSIVVYLDESTESALCEDIKRLLESTPRLNDPRLNKALEAITQFFATTDFNVLTAKEGSQWDILVGLSNGADAIELKFYVDKGGFVTKVMPERASSNTVIDLMKGMLNE